MSRGFLVVDNVLAFSTKPQTMNAKPNFDGHSLPAIDARHVLKGKDKSVNLSQIIDSDLITLVIMKSSLNDHQIRTFKPTLFSTII